MKQPLKEGSEVHRSSIKFVVFFLHSSFLIVLIHSDFLGCVCARVSMIYDHVVFGYGFRTEKFLQELLAKSELCVCVRFHVSAENVPVNIGTTGAFLCIPVIYYLFIYLFYLFIYVFIYLFMFILLLFIQLCYYLFMHYLLYIHLFLRCFLAIIHATKS